MKILHLTKKYPNALGGDAIVVSNLERQQKELGHEIFIVASNCPEIKENILKFGLKDKPHNLDRITIRRIVSLLGLFFWGFKHLRRLKPDVIHSHSADLGFFISLPAKLYGIPIVNTCHGISFPYAQYGYVKRLAEKFFLKYGGFKRIISVDKGSLVHFRGAGIENVVHIPNGVDLEKFQGERKRGGTFRFLFVGRLEPQKGLQYLIEAIALLKDYDFEVFIVGEGSQREELRKLAEELGVNHLVRFLGRKDGEELVELYLSSDAFVLPSTWEGLPLTVLEAWAAGLPIIATAVGGVQDICVDGENSLVVKPGDSSALAEAMARLVQEDDLREKLSRVARERVRDFSWENTSRAILDLYEGLRYR